MEALKLVFTARAKCETRHLARQLVEIDVLAGTKLRSASLKQMEVPRALESGVGQTSKA